MNTELTPLQKTQAAYAHFTLEEWKLLASCVRHQSAAMHGTKQALPEWMTNMHGTKQALPEWIVNNLLVKFPSAVL
jgi:hypothetical protein